jgi:serine/threonine protein kinase/tetratricopeptide (TPR) repeat protein
MSAKRDREEEIFDAARELASNERAAYLAMRCGQDADLRLRIEGMLEADAAAGEFFKTREAPPSTVVLTSEDASLSIEKPGDRIGHYKLLQQIGEGGMGLVYMAEQDQPVRRSVALKIIKLGMDTRQVVARFEAERQALAMMNHPHIAKVFDAGVTDSGRPYFVMELVRGVPITQYCDKNCLPTRQRLDLFILVCQAVQHAHQKGVIHRDLKPSNILVTLNDGVPWPMIIDFGIAKATHQRLTEKTLFTHFAQMIGTPAYMSPEQAEMSKLDVDTRSDIYSLGVLLYELLTGETPFKSEELLAQGIDAMRRTLREKDPAPPSTRLSTMMGPDLTVIALHRQADAPKLVKLVRGDLDWIVMKCLEKDRTRRYDTANGLATDIERHLSCQPIVARPPSRWYEFQKTVKRHKFGFAAATALVLVLILGLVFSTWQAVRATKAEKLADDRLAEAVRAGQEAEAISTFMSDVIQSPDPTRDGRSIQVVELLDRAAKKLDTELAGQPRRKAALQGRLGNTYVALGLYREAIPLQEKVRDYCLVTFGQAHSNTFMSLHNLALAYHKAGRREEALKLREEVLALRRKTLGPEHLDTLTSMSALSASYDGAGRLGDALEMREETLRLRRKVNGPEHPDTIGAMSNLASSYFDANRRDEALKLREETLALSRKTLGPEHPNTLLAMGNLANSYLDANRWDEALKLSEEALALYRKVLGPEHPSTLEESHNVAICYYKAGRREEALNLHEEVLSLRRKTLGPEHPDTLSSMYALSVSYGVAGRNDEALKLVEEALALHRKVLGSEHPNTLGVMGYLAESYRTSGRKDDALKLGEEALALKRKVLGPEHPSTLDVFHNVAIYYDEVGRKGEALKMREEILRLRRKVNGPEHPDTLRAMGNLAGSYRYAGGREEALKLREEVLALCRKVLGPEHPDTLWAMHTLSISYDDTGRKDEALQLSEESLALHRKVIGPEHSETLLVMHNLADYYQAANRMDEAIKLGEERLALKRKVRPEDSDTLWEMIQLVFSYRKAGRTNEAIELGQSSLGLFRRVSGPTHRDTLNAMTELAISYRVAGRLAEAIPLEEESLRLKRQHLSPGHSFTIESIENLAQCYEKADRKSEAATLLSEAAALKAETARARLKSLRKRVQPNDPQLDKPLVKLTQLLIDAQKYAEAEEVARESLALQEKLMPDKWVLFNTRSVLGGILVERKNYAEAEPLLLSGYEGLKQQLDTLPAAGKLSLSNSLSRLAHLYEAVGPPEKAAEWNKKLTEFDQALTEKQGPTPKVQPSQP